MQRKILRGDLYYADFGSGVGSEQEGIRPAVILQNNLGNYYSPTVILAPLSTRVAGKSRLPVHCRLPSGDGLLLESVALLEQVRTVDKLRLTEYIGHLPEACLRRIDWSIAVSLGLAADYNELPLELCLCAACAGQFYRSGAHYISRADLLQTVKHPCDYCAVGMGYDFVIHRHKPIGMEAGMAMPLDDLRKKR